MPRVARKTLHWYIMREAAVCGRMKPKEANSMPDVAKSVLVKHPRPWKVYSAPLRPNFPTKIIEVHDANGRAVIPWLGFDDTGDKSYKQRLSIARLFVTLVNSAA